MQLDKKNNNGLIANWKILFVKMLLINENMLNKNLPASDTKKCLSNFHEQVLHTWLQVKRTQPETDL